MNYDSFLGANAQQVTAYANQAQAVGIKIIWSMKDPQFWDGTNLLIYFSALAATCNCSDNPGFIRYLVSLVDRSPATWGYYVGDEVLPSSHSQWLPFTNLVHQTDPGHPRLFVAAVPDYLYGNATTAAFADGAEVLGQDYYPIGNDRYVTYTQTDQVARTVQSEATAAGREAAMALQAVSWQDYPPAQCSPYPACAPFPNLLQLKQMLGMTVGNSSMRLVMYYSYKDILRSSDPAGNWANLVTALQTYASAALPRTIYDNGLESPFYDYTAGPDYTYLNPCDTSTFVSSPCSYAIALRAQKGHFWQTSTPVSLAGYTSLDWNMNTKGQPITDFGIGFQVNGVYDHVDLRPSYVTNTFTSRDGWVHISVPIAQFNLNGASITLMKLANWSSTDLATIYIDDMTLLSSPQTIYDNGLESPFYDYTTGGDYTYLNPCDTSTFVSSPCSYAIALRAQKGHFWQTSIPVSLAGYTSLDWNMNTRGQPITDFGIGFQVNGVYDHVDLRPSHVTSTFGDGWVHISIPIAQFNLNGAPITLMKVANWTSTDLATIYIDDVTLS